MGDKKYAILASGGDAPGMNAVIRASARVLLAAGNKVVIIKRGYKGLLNEDFIEFDDPTGVSEIIDEGGCFVMSARCEEFRYPEYVKKAADICKKHGINGLVAIGGDGTFRGAQDLSAMGINCIGVPGTIDNDISSTEYTVGFDTALQCIVNSVERLKDTSHSHDRCTVVEVMGRKAGYLAVNAAIATGATAVLVREIDFDIQRDVLDRIENGRKLGKNYFIIIVSEGINDVLPSKGLDSALFLRRLAVKYLGDSAEIEKAISESGFFAASQLLYNKAAEKIYSSDLPEKKINEKIAKLHADIAKTAVTDAATPLATYIEQELGIECRAAVLGHIQRGGTPTADEKIIASRLGAAAAHLLLEDKTNRVVALVKGEVKDFDIDEALAMKKTVDPGLYKLAYEISI